uniref:K Homology domain-containing protein n=1 Tax=Ditylum brightwellii TaxID=49249 RepID=A0A6V2EA13_9STRA
MSAEEAIARAKAIAARLAGGAGVPAGVAVAAPLSSVAPAQTVDAATAAAAASALEAAFGGAGGGGSNGLSAPAPAAGTSSESGGAPKRKRWSAEEALAAAIPGLTPITNTGLSDPSKRAKTDDDDANSKTSKKIWIPSDKNPGYNYVGLLIGPGGSKQRELVEKSGGNVKISIRGRGSNSTPSVPGAPEEPLHVLLEGDAECVSQADRLITELLNDSAKANAEKAQQLAEVSATKNAERDGGPGAPAPAPSASTYKPTPVAQLLGLGGTPASTYGPAGGTQAPAGANMGAGGAPGQELVEEKIGVPNGVVGYIIGKGGESITDMQRRTGCRVQIQKEHEMQAGSTQRVITLTAATKEAVSQCRGIIEGMVQERLRLNAQSQTHQNHHQVQIRGGGGTNAASQAAQLQQALAEGQCHVTVQVPDADVGLIIGKGGTSIRSMQDRSGANIQIPPCADPGNPMVRTVNITHPSAEGANFAKQLIEEIMRNKMGNQGAGGSVGSGGMMGGGAMGGAHHGAGGASPAAPAAGETSIQIMVSVFMIKLTTFDQIMHGMVFQWLLSGHMLKRELDAYTQRINISSGFPSFPIFSV